MPKHREEALERPSHRVAPARTGGGHSAKENVFPPIFPTCRIDYAKKRASQPFTQRMPLRGFEELALGPITNFRAHFGFELTLSLFTPSLRSAHLLSAHK